jgi:hypothetical protein
MISPTPTLVLHPAGSPQMSIHTPTHFHHDVRNSLDLLTYIVDDAATQIYSRYALKDQTSKTPAAYPSRLAWAAHTWGKPSSLAADRPADWAALRSALGTIEFTVPVILPSGYYMLS